MRQEKRGNLVWVDKTSYSRKDILWGEETEPRVWECSITPEGGERPCSPVRIVVHQYVGHGNDWFLSVDALDIKMHDLETEDVELAWRKAVAVVNTALAEKTEWLAAVAKELRKAASGV